VSAYNSCNLGEINLKCKKSDPTASLAAVLFKIRSDRRSQSLYYYLLVRDIVGVLLTLAFLCSTKRLYCSVAVHVMIHDHRFSIFAPLREWESLATCEEPSLKKLYCDRCDGLVQSCTQSEREAAASLATYNLYTTLYLVLDDRVPCSVLELGVE